MDYVQSLAHAWYHTPNNKRRSHFGILYYLCTFLEYVTILSTERHRSHHRHDLNSLDEVRIWSDFRFPLFVERHTEDIWTYLKKIYVKGETRMDTCVAVVEPIYLVLITVSILYLVTSIDQCLMH